MRPLIFDVEPFWNRVTGFVAEPAVDIVDKEMAYEISTERPGMDDTNIQVNLVNGPLVITADHLD